MTALTSLISLPVALIAAGSFWSSEYTVRGKTSVNGAPHSYLVTVVNQRRALTGHFGDQIDLLLPDPLRSPSRKE